MAKTHKSLKKERFKKVAARRTAKVLEDLEKLSRCSDRNNYDYTEEEVKKMIKAIKEGIVSLENSYSKAKNKGHIFEF